tara:strand:+ start:344 stop:598 length:255 start_codon:yes stop_codon:yes gene_type:complete
MKNLIRSVFIICRVDEDFFTHFVELSSKGLDKRRSNCVKLNVWDTFDTKLEALEYLANNHQKGYTDFVILEKYKLVKAKSKESK